MSTTRRLLGVFQSKPKRKPKHKKNRFVTSHITYTRGKKVVDGTFQIFLENNVGWISVFADKKTAIAFYRKFHNDRLPFFCNLIWLHYRNKPAVLIEEGFVLFNSEVPMKYHIWVYNSSQTKVISMSYSFTKLFKSIIAALRAIHDKEWYHGNLLNGITVSENLDVKLCNVSKQHLRLEAGIEKDLKDLRTLVERVITTNPIDDPSFARPDFVSLYFEFPEMFDNIQLDPSIEVNRARFRAYFEFNNPIFSDQTDRLILVKKFVNLRESFTVEIDTKLTFESSLTNLVDWWMRLPPGSYMFERLNHDLRCYLCKQKQIEPMSIIGFYRVCLYHKMDARFPLDELAMLARLTEIYPDFLPKVYYEFVKVMAWEELNCTRYGSYIEFFQMDVPQLP